VPAPGPLQIASPLSFYVEENTEETVSVSVNNPNTAVRTAAIEIVNPHTDLLISPASGDSFVIDALDTATLLLDIDSTAAAVGVYKGILLKLTDDTDRAVYANVTVAVTPTGAPELPDLAISADDIQLVAYDASDSTITLDAAIHNVGTATASDVTVRFYEFNTLLSEAEVVDIPAGEMRSVPITIAMPAAGERLIQVVLDPLDAVEELDETNNEATQVLLVNTGDLTEGHILITGSVPSSVCSSSSFSVTGTAVYDLYVDGVRYTDYAVKGGMVEMTVIGPDGEQWLYEGKHTNIHGAFSQVLAAPETPGIYGLLITVTDNTFISERWLVFEVRECSSSTPPPGPPYYGPGGGSGGSGGSGGGGGSGDWVPPGSGSGGGGSTEWTWVWTERPPGAPASDVYVYSENIHFSVNHPDPGQEITIFAEIRYWAESTILPAQDVPINIYATFPGEARTKIGETVIDELTVGAPDFGSEYVFTTWKADWEGIYIIEVEVDPSYSEENMFNNAATRAIIVGDLGQPWGAIEGQVREALGGADGIVIDLYNDDHTILIEGTITNNCGYYLFTDLPAGTYQVHIRTPEGYAADTQTEPAEVVAQEITAVNFFLSQTAAPVADAGGPYSAEVGSPVTLDASGSYDPDGAIVLYEWDWDNDGTYDFSTTSPTCTHTWSTSFSGSVPMRVTDDDGLSSIDTALVEIEGSGHGPVDDLTDVTFDTLRFDRRTGQSSVIAMVTNTSTTIIGEPVWLAINDITDPAVTFLDADGTTDGKPYIDLTSLLGDGQLAPGETIETRIYFNNPTRQRFELDTSVYGMTTP